MNDYIMMHLHWKRDNDPHAFKTDAEQPDQGELLGHHFVEWAQRSMKNIHLVKKETGKNEGNKEPEKAEKAKEEGKSRHVPSVRAKLHEIKICCCSRSWTTFTQKVE